MNRMVRYAQCVTTRDKQIVVSVRCCEMARMRALHLLARPWSRVHLPLSNLSH